MELFQPQLARSERSKAGWVQAFSRGFFFCSKRRYIRFKIKKKKKKQGNLLLRSDGQHRNEKRMALKKTILGTDSVKLSSQVLSCQRKEQFYSFDLRCFIYLFKFFFFALKSAKSAINLDKASFLKNIHLNVIVLEIDPQLFIFVIKPLLFMSS